MLKALALPIDELPNFEGEQGVFAGFGKFRDNRPSDRRLRWAVFKIISSKQVKSNSKTIAFAVI